MANSAKFFKLADNAWVSKSTVRTVTLFTTAGFDPADNPYWDPNPVRYLDLISGCGRKRSVPLFCLSGDLHDLLVDLGFDLNGVNLDKDQTLDKGDLTKGDPDDLFWVHFDTCHHHDGSVTRTYWGNTSDYYWGSDKILSHNQIKTLGIVD